MICPYCKRNTKDDALFCAACGHKIARCPSCNRVLRASARFCAFDGTPLPPELLQDLPPLAASAPQPNPQPEPEPQPNPQPEPEPQPEPQQYAAYVPEGTFQPSEPLPEKERSKLPIILGIVLAVVLLIGAVVGVGLWQGWFSSDRSDDEEDTFSVSADEADDQSEAPDEAVDAEDSAVEPDGSAVSSEDALQSEGDGGAAQDAAQSSEGAAESEARPNEEAEDSEVPVSQRTYEVVAGDLSWSEACEAAAEAGGHLATITSEEEYDVICALAEDSGLKYLWLGAALTLDEMVWGEDGCWITGESWSFDVWYPGEPSLEDADGTPETCLCLWNAAYEDEDIGWTFNDQRDNLVEDFPSVSGKVGYIIEYDDGYTE